MSGSARRAALVTAVRGAGEPGDLARACLLVEQGEYPLLDAPGVIAALDAYGADVRDAVLTGVSPGAALRLVLADAAGFCGRRENYDDPDNSYLSRVVERRHGLPILLAVVWIETARSAGVPGVGIGLPGHFVARVGAGDAAEIVDPFEGGVRRAPDEAEAIASALTGESPPEPGAWLRPVGTAAIITRVLGNLAGSYDRRGDLARLERVLGDQLALYPEAAPLRVRRGEVRATRGDLSGALVDLNEALAGLPIASPYHQHVRERAAQIVRRMESLN